MTEKQQAIYDAVKNHIEEYGHPPTLRELADSFKITPVAIKDHLLAIEKKGYIEYGAGDQVKARAIKVIK